jgi:hypothetical protein
MTSSYLNSNTYVESVDSVVYIEFIQDEANGPLVIEVFTPGSVSLIDLSDSTPQALGTAAAGTATTGSRSDHQHAMPNAGAVGADALGTAAAAVAAHEEASDPHPGYTTAAEVRTVLTQTLTYAATINLDLASLTGTHQILTLTGAVEFTTSNRALGHWVTIFIDPGASNRALTFPAGWTFYSAKPSTQTANKRAVLTLKANGTGLSDIHAAWKEAP